MIFFYKLLSHIISIVRNTPYGNIVFIKCLACVGLYTIGLQRA